MLLQRSAFLAMALGPSLACADTASAAPDHALAINSVWLMATAALVFLMQAGFALVESGMSRSKNAVNVIMKTTWIVASAA